MRAAIVAVGSELLGTDRLDTNSLRLTEVLESYGLELRRKSVVGDDEEEIAAELQRLLSEHEVVLVTGGLGPTADDVTRQAAADALGRSLTFDEKVFDEIAARFREYGIPMPDVNRRQAEVIEGAEWIPNPRGTAPGMKCSHDGATLFLFPGVPAELEPMISSHLEPWLAERSGGAQRESLTLKVACLPESTVEERIAPAYEEFGRDGLSILAKPGEIRLRLTAGGSERERQERLSAMKRRLMELLAEAVFTDREDDELEAVVGRLLRDREVSLVTAESCTGGLLAERLTRIAGSSDYFLGGVVAYSNRYKIDLLGVDAGLVEAHGAVSEEVARSMAEGARRRLGGDYGVAITGVAGPAGGTSDKPVGTVHIAVASPSDATAHRRVRFPGDRERVRWQSSQLALEMLRRRLLRVEVPKVVGQG